VVQTEARGETGAMMEGMVEEKGIVPERSEWFRSSGIIGTAQGQVCIEEGGCTTVFCDLHMQAVNGGTKSERRRALRQEA
jgi:hypothetical protein